MADNKKSKTKSTETSLYYFFTQGCGFCKKVDPIVDELIKEGHNILKLDLADGNNRSLQDEVKNKYNAQCGTPWFVDGETGNQICGYREKDVLEKWAKGEEIPQPVRPTGPPPKVPLMDASDEEVKTWKKEYGEWYKKNEKLPNVKDAEQMLKLPRPKTEPPKPPSPTASDKELDKWGEPTTKPLTPEDLIRAVGSGDWNNIKQFNDIYNIFGKDVFK